MADRPMTATECLQSVCAATGGVYLSTPPPCQCEAEIVRLRAALASERRLREEAQDEAQRAAEQLESWQREALRLRGVVAGLRAKVN
jgi:hypothetical protein